MFKKLSFLGFVFLAVALMFSCHERGPSGAAAPDLGQVVPDGGGDVVPDIAAGAEGGACLADDICNTGLVCVDGKCKLLEVNIPTCEDVGCPEGEVCKDQVCVVAESGCKSDAECGENNVCKDGACVAKEITCLAGETLVDSVCKKDGMLGGVCVSGTTCELGLKCEQSKCIGAAQWVSLNFPIEDSLSTVVAQDYHNSIYVGTNNGALYKYEANNWKKLNEASSLKFKPIRSLLSVGNVIYIGTIGAGVHKYSPDSNEWSEIKTGLDDPNIYDLVLLKDGTIFAGTAKGVCKYDGSKWQWINAKLPITTVLALLYANNTVIAGVYGEGVYKYNSKNEWEAMNSGGMEDAVVHEFASTTEGLTIYAAALQGVYKYVNSSWEKMSNSLPTPNEIKLSICGKDSIYAGMSSGQGIYHYNTSIGVWEEMNNGLGEKHVNSLYCYQSEGAIYAATYGGVYKYVP